jgi:hypothetical protein
MLPRRRSRLTPWLAAGWSLSWVGPSVWSSDDAAAPLATSVSVELGRQPSRGPDDCCWAVAIVQLSGSVPASDCCFAAPDRLLATPMAASACVLTTPRSAVAMLLKCGSAVRSQSAPTHGKEQPGGAGCAVGGSPEYPPVPGATGRLGDSATSVRSCTLADQARLCTARVWSPVTRCGDRALSGRGHGPLLAPGRRSGRWLGRRRRRSRPRRRRWGQARILRARPDGTGCRATNMPA